MTMCPLYNYSYLLFYLHFFYNPDKHGKDSRLWANPRRLGRFMLPFPCVLLPWYCKSLKSSVSSWRAGLSSSPRHLQHLYHHLVPSSSAFLSSLRHFYPHPLFILIPFNIILTIIFDILISSSSTSSSHLHHPHLISIVITLSSLSSSSCHHHRLIILIILSSASSFVS